MSALRLGTRGSRLALWQAHFIRRGLEQEGHAVVIHEITTRGDRIQEKPISQIGDEALFTRALDRALLAGDIDFAVHSLKDIPTRIPDEVVMAAIGRRGEPWDAFIAHPSFAGTLEDLPRGAKLATSSLRRRAQLKAWRSDIEVVPVRGNVPTRLDKLDGSDWHGMILAVAGLERLGLEGRIRQAIPDEIMLPAVSQGALGVVCRREDRDTYTALREAVHHAPTAQAARCERAFLRRLEGGCQIPVGAHARLESDVLLLEGCVVSLNGRQLVRSHREGDPSAPEALGVQLADELLDRGARSILDEVRRQAGAP